MTQKQARYAKALKKQIHLSSRYKHYYKDDREAYEELLKKHFGVTSSTKLKIDDLVKLRDYMEHKLEELPIYKGKCATPAQLCTMLSMWQNYANDVSEEALLVFTNKQLKKSHVNLNLITLLEAQKMIPTLKKMQEAKDG